MEHFEMQDWIDFARQSRAPQQIAAMQRHLDDGCSKCLKNLDIWRRVVEFINNERSYEPPKSVIHQVTASFALLKVIRQTRGEVHVARLVFDSIQSPLAVGVRSGSAQARQLLYKSGTVCIDMHMQTKPGSDWVVLMGQVLDSARPAHGMGAVPVSLLSDGDTLSRKKTNDVGEFDFGFGALRNLQLAFAIAEQRTLVVPVPTANTGLGHAVV